MGKPYSMDLRERVVAAVDPGGLSCHKAAAQFGEGVNTAILWVRRFRETGSVAPGQMGGTSRRRFRGSTVIGCASTPRQGTSPCAGWWPNSPSVG
jgi:putative transposase